VIPRPSASALRGLDPRAKAGLALVLGLAVWRAGWPGLALYLAGLTPVCLSLQAFHAENRRTFAAALGFALFWAGLVGLLQWVDVGFSAALAQAALLGARLATLLLMGLGLALATPPRDLGRALAWALRPVLGQRAWKLALALALMVHFLPLAFTATRQVRLALRQRASHLPFLRQAGLLAQTCLRCLSQRAWDHTLALAARGLDRPAAWAHAFPPAGRQLAGAGLLAALGLAAAWL
jgi:biotin transport system permease protein